MSRSYWGKDPAPVATRQQTISGVDAFSTACSQLWPAINSGMESPEKGCG